MYKEEKERKEAARIGYTEYNLDSYYVIDLYWYLDICPPEFRGSFDENLEKYKYRLEKKNLKLEAGEYTEEIIGKKRETCCWKNIQLLNINLLFFNSFLFKYFYHFNKFAEIGCKNKKKERKEGKNERFER